jgi:predicted ATPase
LRSLVEALNLSSAEPAPVQPSGKPGGRPWNNLPAQLTSFIGRAEQRSDICAALARAHLVTLTGPGGVGKTRLALQVAAEQLGAFGDGACFVDFSPLQNGDVVALTTARALGLRERPGEPLNATLQAALQHRELLLLLDNCEHVLDDVAALVDELLRGCSHLRALATSREALGVEGERIWRVPPLRTHGTSQTAGAPEQVAQSEAAALFLDRASAVQPDVSLTRQSIQALAEICRRLDGIPLGIELAAARTAPHHRADRRAPR